MEKTQGIGAQIYGYSVCLVAVITFLISASSLVNAWMDYQDPLHSGWNSPGTPSLASFENYKMDVLRGQNKGEMPVNLSDQTLKSMYAAAKADKIQSVQHQANRSITISSLLILICSILFVMHWRWMQRIANPVDDLNVDKLTYSD